jgi:two-component system invasion response regulator UvrY
VIHTLIVDDHALVRMGVRRLLEDVKDIRVVGEASSGEEAIQLVDKLMPNVILMDIRMPGIGGFEASRKILKKHTDKVKIIALTSYSNDSFFIDLLEIGVLGYLTKSVSLEEMLEAIRVVHQGQRYINTELANRFILQRFHHPREEKFNSLSKREFEIASNIIRGDSVATIAKRLKVKEKTVNSYRYRIFEKLKIRDDVNLVLLALQEGVLTLSGGAINVVKLQ